MLALGVAVQLAHERTIQQMAIITLCLLIWGSVVQAECSLSELLACIIAGACLLLVLQIISCSCMCWCCAGNVDVRVSCRASAQQFVRCCMRTFPCIQVLLLALRMYGCCVIQKAQGLLFTHPHARFRVRRCCRWRCRCMAAASC